MSSLDEKDSRDGDAPQAVQTLGVVAHDGGMVMEESRMERLSGYFTIAMAGFALISDGLQNNIMSLVSCLFPAR
jgi:hypothetical protein